MNKTLKIILVISLLLNVTLIASGLWARSYIRIKGFELAALNSESQGMFAQYILTQLEDNNSANIEAVKQQLRKSIQQSHQVADIWRKAAKSSK